MELGEKIKMLRQEKGMTLEQLGDAVGVGKSTVRKWENGMIANMRRDKISKVAKALDVSPAYLMGWEEPTDYSLYIKDLQESPILIEVLENAKELSEERIRLMIQMMKEMK